VVTSLFFTSDRLPLLLSSFYFLLFVALDLGVNPILIFKYYA
jgi:hypothetical protein